MGTFDLDHHATEQVRDRNGTDASVNASVNTAPATAQETGLNGPAETPPLASPTRGTIDSYLPQRPLTVNEGVVCVVAIILWIFVAAIGVAVPTKPAIDLLNKPDGKPPFWEMSKALLAILTCYTFTNIAALCCLSAIIGAVGRSARIDDVERNDPATDLRTLCISALIRGFFLYLVVLSGTLFLAEQKFEEISIEQYLKLGGLVSLLSFAIGYDPHLFGSIFTRVVRWEETSQPPTGQR